MKEKLHNTYLQKTNMTSQSRSHPYEDEKDHSVLANCNVGDRPHQANQMFVRWGALYGSFLLTKWKTFQQTWQNKCHQNTG